LYFFMLLCVEVSPLHNVFRVASIAGSEFWTEFTELTEW
jgi:hypothetical protein